MNCNEMKGFVLTSSTVQMLGGLHVIFAVVFSVTESWIIWESSCLFLFLHTQLVLHSLKCTAA